MTLTDHLPAIIVLLPLVAAPLCALLGRGRTAWGLTFVVACASFAGTLVLFAKILDTGPADYAFGGWPAPWGIAYRVDLLGGFVLLLITLTFTMVAAFARKSVAKEIPRDREAPFYAALLLAVAGFAGITVTADLFNLFVFLEISSLASYALVAMGRDRRALTAAFRYLVMGTIGATFVLIGIGFLYMITGTLNMPDLAARLPAATESRTLNAALAFLTVGIGLKLAMFPLHQWLPGAYAHAPSVVSALLAATATKVAIYAMLRVLLGVFDPAFSLAEMPLGVLFMVLGAAGVLAGSLAAVFQEDVKRLLAWSSIAQIGYMVLAIGLATRAGITAAVLHLFNHGLMKAVLFLAVGALAYRLGVVRLHDLAGVVRYMPWTFGALVIGGLSLIGVPGTVGFISKWSLVLAAIDRQLWPVAAVVLIGSVLALVYVLRMLEACRGGLGGDPGRMPREAPPSMLVPIWLLALANLWFGLSTELTLGIAERISGDLAGGLGPGLGLFTPGAAP